LRERVLGNGWNVSETEEFMRDIIVEQVPRDKAHAMIAASQAGIFSNKPEPGFFIGAIGSNMKMAARAILPLTLLLACVLLFFLRERPGRGDEIVIGILFAFFGLGLFNVGMELGLAKLGQQVGGLLPSTFKTIQLTDESKVIKKFDTTLVTDAITKNGGRERFFYARLSGRYEQIPYDSNRYNPAAAEYLYTPQRGPASGSDRGVWGGFLLLFLFALVMGYGATLAEPALTTFGIKVEELTVGIFRKGLLKQSAALGVGVGMAFGVAKIL
jgi:hypothetical protein